MKLSNVRILQSEEQKGERALIQTSSIRITDYFYSLTMSPSMNIIFCRTEPYEGVISGSGIFDSYRLWKGQ
ncbi:hypothetical protein AKJ41_00955 [candidate division MSBL1 archaeon SCGC-AAA259O05]|uniref:Uncharacterized protein n=1 Tax=candidate division MSBL1 archaeon SCGC-AAA259O05 TaxID=1698271 RepID=A0A133V592_9EURY|nr:hypothetical protein AKJ41_00955 [candidate division MSBL1 archaeon SCGC-AAA259O05]